MLGDRPAIPGDRHQAAEWRALPVAGAEDNGDDARFATLLTLQRTTHLDVVAIVGVHEIDADQQQDDVGGVQFVADSAVKRLARRDAAIMPGGNCALPLEAGQVLFKLVPEILVPMRVGHEDMGHGPLDLPDCSLTESTLRTEPVSGPRHGDKPSQVSLSAGS